MARRELEPTRRSSWSLKAKVARSFWGLIWNVLGVCSGIRIALVRMFGGTIGRRCRIGRGVEIAVPWNLRLGDDVDVGDEAILYSLGRIEVEDGVRIDARAHLCAGTHDHRQAGFPLIRSPIFIGRGARIGAGSFIGPGVRIGAEAGVAPQAAVFRDVAKGSMVRGNPASVDAGVDDRRAEERGR